MSKLFARIEIFLLGKLKWIISWAGFRQFARRVADREYLQGVKLRLGDHPEAQAFFESFLGEIKRASPEEREDIEKLFAEKWREWKRSK